MSITPNRDHNNLVCYSMSSLNQTDTPSVSGEKRGGRRTGIWFGVLSAATFGLIPLFSIPELEAGMSSFGVLFYRFVFASVIMLVLLLLNHKSLRLTPREWVIMALFGLLYDCSAICLYYGYRYMSSGAATTLLFMYPVWTAVIMAVFYGERLSKRTILAIVLALLGVFFLSGGRTVDAGAPWYVVGVVLLSGLSYSVYMVLVDRLDVRRLGSLKLTFYCLFFSLIYLTVYLFVSGKGIEAVPNAPSWANLFLLGLIPTVVSNVFLIKSIEKIGSTLAAILGAFEPVIAVVVGVSLLGEAFTLRSALGISLIIFAVILLVLRRDTPGEKDLSKTGEKGEEIVTLGNEKHQDHHTI